LNRIKSYLVVGSITLSKNGSCAYSVQSIKDLAVIIDHFDKYPLISAKYSDFLLFKQCYDLIKQKEHLTQAGFEKILALKYNLNIGLPDELKSAFPNIVPVARPEYKFNGIPNPFWISGRLFSSNKNLIRNWEHYLNKKN